uniref:Tudor and KH domain-containing protein n=1 Tax=Lygus hesperus TaxID=30085 RepID=A0A0A9XUH1_LYGHE
MVAVLTDRVEDLKMEYHSSLKASLDVFQRILSNSSSAVLTLKNLCRDLDEGKSLGVEAASKVCQLQSRVTDLSDGLMQVMEEFASLDSTVAEIPWLHSERSKLDMTYISGDNPWEFSLTYSNKEKLNEIGETLKAIHGENGLRRFGTLPKIDQFVVCQVGKNFFRARVLKTFQNGRVKVSKSDFNEDVVLQLPNVYELPREVASIPCQSVRCCLNKEDQYLEERWGKELILIFKKTLSECQLTVDILEKLNCFSPPKYYIRMYVFNEDTGEEMNLSSWINNKLLPDLKMLSSDEVEDMMAVLDEECMDPFLFGQVKTDDIKPHHELSNLNLNKESSNSKTSTTDVPSNSNSLPDQDEKLSKSLAAEASSQTDDNEHLDEPDQHLIGLSVEKVSTWMHQYSDEETIKMNRRAAKIVVPVLEEPSFSFSKAKTSVASVAKNPEPSVKVEEEVRSTSKSSYTSAKENPRASSRMSVNAPEFVPSCFVEINPGCNEESFENVISNLEDEYQPQDEKRICLFYQKKGFCTRIACNKEHVKRTNKWTDDVAEIEKGPFNNIDLPREGCVTFLQVQHVENATTFYSTLNEIYAEINEYGVRETLEACTRTSTRRTSALPPTPSSTRCRRFQKWCWRWGCSERLGLGGSGFARS